MHEEAPPSASTAPATVSSVIDKLIPREKPKLLPMPSSDKPQVIMTARSPDSIEVSTSSSSSAAASAPSNSAIQALFGKKVKLVSPTHLDTIPKKESIHDVKKKDSLAPNTDPEDDTSEIKTSPMISHLPPTPLPTIVELKAPIKPLSSNSLTFPSSIPFNDCLLASQSNDMAKRAQYYQVSTMII